MEQEEPLFDVSDAPQPFPCQEEEEEVPSGLSKNACKRLARIDYIKTHRKEVRARKKVAKQQSVKVLDTNPDRVCKRDRIQAEKDRLKSSQMCYPSVVVDCAYDSFMSEKEINKTRMQILRCYHLLKSPDTKLFHLHLSNFQEDSNLNKSFQEKTPGFDSMFITKFAEPIFERFSASEIIYLTPDSPNLLESVSDEFVYVIGGFVDDNIKRHTSMRRCEENDLRTASLPISQYFEKVNHKQEVLTINQVCEILFSVYNGESWKEVFSKVLPTRKGYLPLQESEPESEFGTDSESEFGTDSETEPETKPEIKSETLQESETDDIPSYSSLLGNCF